MTIKIGIFLILSVLSFAFSSDNINVDYKHKSLIKTLQKGGVVNLAAIVDFELPDSMIESSRIMGKFFQIVDTIAYQYKYIYVGRVNSCRAGGCAISGERPTESKSEYFDYFILFDLDKTVRNIKVFNYQATHGQEITAKGWLKQFIGYNGTEPLQVGKNIDAIAGATISVYAITDDVEQKVNILRSFK